MDKLLRKIAVLLSDQLCTHIRYFCIVSESNFQVTSQVQQDKKLHVYISLLHGRNQKEYNKKSFTFLIKTQN